MRLQSVCLVVLIVCVGVIARVEGKSKKNKTTQGLTGKALIDELEKQMDAIRKLIKPNYAPKEVDVISGRWGEFLKRLASIDNHKSVPRKYIFQIMELHLIMLRTVKPTVVQMYNNEKLEQLFAHFADNYKATKAQIEKTKEARHEFEDILRKKIQRIDLERRDPKKKSSVTNTYARIFNEMTTFLQIDDLGPETAIKMLDLDEALLRADPPILTPQIMAVRNHEKIEAEVGRIINHLHQDKRHDRAQRYINSIHKHYDGLHDALALARKISSGKSSPEDQSALVKLWIGALKRNIFYTKYVTSYKMTADNQMRFHIIHKLLPKLEFLHTNKEVLPVYQKMAANFDLYKKTYDENTALMEHLEKYVASNPQTEEHAKEWLKIVNTLTVTDMSHKLSSIYIYEVLLHDLEFVKNEHIVSEKLKAERTKQLPAIRQAANSMFIFNKHKESKLYEPFEKALIAFDTHVYEGHLKDVDDILNGTDMDTMIGQVNKKWPYMDLILTHYAPYLSDFDGTITTQLSILHVFAKVAKWKFHDVTHFVAVIKEMELNSEIYFKIDDIQNEADEIEEKEEDEEEAAENKKHAKDPKATKGHEHDHDHHHDHDHEHHHHRHHELHGPCQHAHNGKEHVEDSKHQMCRELITTYEIILRHRRQHDIHLARQWRTLVHKYEHEIQEHKVCTFGTKQMAVVKAFHHEIMH